MAEGNTLPPSLPRSIARSLFLHSLHPSGSLAGQDFSEVCQTDAAGGGGAARARRRGVLNLNRQRSIGRRALLRPLRLTPSCLMTRAPSAMRKQLQNTQAVHFGWVASGTYLWNPFESRMGFYSSRITKML